MGGGAPALPERSIAGKQRRDRRFVLAGEDRFGRGTREAGTGEDAELALARAGIGGAAAERAKAAAACEGTGGGELGIGSRLAERRQRRVGITQADPLRRQRRADLP